MKIGVPISSCLYFPVAHFPVAHFPVIILPVFRFLVFSSFLYGLQCRQADRKRAALSFFALNFNRAVVLLDDAEGDAQPQARSLAHRLRGEERLENPLQQFLLDAAARIGHAEDDAAVAGRGGDRQTPAVGHGRAGVQGEIQEDLLQLDSCRRGLPAGRPARPLRSTMCSNFF